MRPEKTVARHRASFAKSALLRERQHVSVLEPGVRCRACPDHRQGKSQGSQLSLDCVSWRSCSSRLSSSSFLAISLWARIESTQVWSSHNSSMDMCSNCSRYTIPPNHDHPQGVPIGAGVSTNFRLRTKILARCVLRRTVLVIESVSARCGSAERLFRPIP